MRWSVREAKVIPKKQRPKDHTRRFLNGLDRGPFSDESIMNSSAGMIPTKPAVVGIGPVAVATLSKSTFSLRDRFSPSNLNTVKPSRVETIDIGSVDPTRSP